MKISQFSSTLIYIYEKEQVPCRPVTFKLIQIQYIDEAIVLLLPSEFWQGSCGSGKWSKPAAKINQLSLYGNGVNADQFMGVIIYFLSNIISLHLVLNPNTKPNDN